MHVNKAEIFKFKVRDNIPWYKLCVESVSRDFAKLELREVSLNCTVYIFSVDHSVTEKIIFSICNFDQEEEFLD